MILPVLSTGALTPASVSPVISPGRPELSDSLENLPAESRLILLPLLNTESLNTEHSKCLLNAIPNRNCLIHLVKQSAYKELNAKLYLTGSKRYLKTLKGTKIQP